MKLYFAPMEGITGVVFRRVHAEMFGGADRYFSPFIAPDANGAFKNRDLISLLPENNLGLTLVPQILANNAGAFIRCASAIHELGYEEVDLNLGCPSGTVTAKHKGSGMLADPQALDGFLADIFMYSPVRISVKTRMGLCSTDEFGRLLEVYNKYPLTELIVHARDRAGMYKSLPDRDGFVRAFDRIQAPAVYNGDIFTPEDVRELSVRLPALERMMIGRGACADPSLFRRSRGGKALEKAELREYAERLLAETLASGVAENYAVSRMKELWFYMAAMFPGAERAVKAINKSRSLFDYREAVNMLFGSGCFDPNAHFANK